MEEVDAYSSNATAIDAVASIMVVLRSEAAELVSAPATITVEESSSLRHWGPERKPQQTHGLLPCSESLLLLALSQQLSHGTRYFTEAFSSLIEAR